MTRRLLFLASIALFMRADSAKDAFDLVHEMADRLSTGDSAGFLALFDHDMPGYDRLRNNVAGLVSQGDVGCNIEITTNDGDDSERTLTLDWILTMEPKQVNAGSKDWERKARCRIRKIDRKWKVVSFEPLDLFQPPVSR